MSDAKFLLRSLKKGSYPIIEGDYDANYFYIIKKGSVSLSSSTFALTNRKEEILGPGDFFGVISCMSRRPRVDTAETLEDTVLITVRDSDFHDLIKKNIPVSLKIIRYFSHQLRYLNSVLTQLSFRYTMNENPQHLYEIGEHYLSKKINFSYASHALIRYVQQCPDGEYVKLAKTKLAEIYKNHKDKIITEPEKNGYFYHFKDDQMIFSEHELGNELYIIQSGEVKISKMVKSQEVLLNILKKGDIFGEMAILENRPRTATAIAGSDVKLMAISRNNFIQVVKEHPEIAIQIIKLLSDRIWFIYRHIGNTLITEPETRIYDALYILLLNDRVNIRAGGPHTFKMEYSDLLDFVGLNNREGRDALTNIVKNNKALTTKKNKVHCTDITSIEKKMNVIQRNINLKGFTARN